MKDKFREFCEFFYADFQQTMKDKYRATPCNIRKTISF